MGWNGLACCVCPCVLISLVRQWEKVGTQVPRVARLGNLHIHENITECFFHDLPLEKQKPGKLVVFWMNPTCLFFSVTVLLLWLSWRLLKYSARFTVFACLSELDRSKLVLPNIYLLSYTVLFPLQLDQGGVPSLFAFWNERTPSYKSYQKRYSLICNYLFLSTKVVSS